MKEDFKTINLSGRQRMLSQRIALLAGKNEPELLRGTILEFKKGQDFLLKGRFVSREYPEIYDIYKKEGGLEKIGAEYTKLASSEILDSEKRNELFMMSQDILRKYDEATLTTQQISENEFNNRLLLEVFILSGTLILLCLEIIFIFQPMLRNVHSTFEQIKDIEQKSFLGSRLALIGEISSGIAHEIKNPLSVILVFSKKLATEPPSKDVDLMHSHLYKNAERIAKIVRSLSSQSRESSHDPMTKVPVRSVIDDAVEIFSSKLMASGITLSTMYNFEGDLHCRQSAISQVIANLVSNAIDAVSQIPKEGLKEIKIETGENEREVYVRVIDNGPGVPETLRDKIFESFITTKENGKGTGIGLSISRKIMQEHEGALALNSAISHSCFELKFPKTA